MKIIVENDGTWYDVENVDFPVKYYKGFQLGTNNIVTLCSDSI